ncbi:MAG: transposase family protein [Planctomycetota bacterium]
MRATTIFRDLLGLSKTVVKAVCFTEDSLRVEVKPRWRKPRCGGCGKKAPGYDQQKLRSWRHLNLGRTRIALEYAPRRVKCKRCGDRVGCNETPSGLVIPRVI